MAPPAETQSKPAHRGRFVIWLTAGLVLIPLVLLLAIYYTLASPLFLSQVWPRIQPWVETHTGIRLEAEQLHIDLLGHIQVQQLHLVQNHGHTDCESLTLTLDQAHLRFDPWALLRQRIHFDQIQLTQLGIQGCVVLPANSEGESLNQAATAEPWQTTLRDQLQPVWPITLEHLQLDHFAADLRAYQPDQGSVFHWQGEGQLDSRLDWQPHVLSGRLEVALHTLAPLALDWQDATTQLRGHLTPHLSLTLEWLVDNGINKPLIQLKQLDMELALLEGQLELSQTAMTAQVDWPAYQLRLNQQAPLLLSLDSDLAAQLDLQLSSRWADWSLTAWLAEAGDLQTQGSHELSFQAQGEVKLGQGLDPALDIGFESIQRLQALVFQPADPQIPSIEIDQLHSEIALNLPARAPSQGWMQLQTQGLHFGDVFAQLSGVLNPQRDQGQLDLEVAFNLQPLLEGSADWQQSSEGLQLKPALTLHLDPEPWGNWWPEALLPLGKLQAILQAELHWAADFAHSLGYPLPQTSQARLEVHQLQTADHPHALRLTQPLITEIHTLTQQDHWQLDLSARSQALSLDPWVVELPFDWAIQLSTPANWNQWSINSQARVNQQPWLALELQLRTSESGLDSEGSLALKAHHQWQTFFPDLASLPDFGALQSSHRWQLHAEAEPDSSAALPWQLTLNMEGDLHWDGQSETLPLQLPLHLGAPLTYQATLAHQQAQVTLSSDWHLPEAYVPEAELSLQAADIHLLLEANTEPLSAPLTLALAWRQPQIHWQDWQADALDLQLDLQMLPVDSSHWQAQAQLNLDAEQLLFAPLGSEPAFATGLAPVFLPLHLALEAEADPDFSHIDLHQLALKLGGGWIAQTLQGQLQPQAPSALLEGLLTLDPALAQASNGVIQEHLQGRMRLPWQFSLTPAEEMSLQAQAEFEDFSLQLDDWSLQHLSGRLSLHQALQRNPSGKLSFLYLLQPDAFQRVDFNRMEPYLDERPAFQLGQIQWQGLTLGPLQAHLPIEQNLIRLQDFTLALFDGHLSGHFYLDLRPDAWRTGLLGRVSGVDLRQLLPETLATTQKAPVTARLALEMDLMRRLLEGRIDLLDIQSDQVLQLLDLIDPDHLDPQLSRVRSALRFGHPQQISLVMQQGLMDMSIQLSLLRDPILVRALPLSPIIERFAAEALMLPQTLPLE